MDRGRKRFFSFVLVLAMILSIMPISVAAQDQSLSAVIPINDGTADLSAVQALSEDASQQVYVSAGVISAQLPDIDFAGLSATSYNARIQAVDDTGSIVAQTSSFPVYSSTTTIISKKIMMMQEMSAGEYGLRLVYGSVESYDLIELNYSLCVVDAPVLTNVNVDLTAGMSPSALTLQVSGYRGNANLYSFSLMDESGKIILCSAKHIKSSKSDANITSLSYELVPSEPLTTDSEYSLIVSSGEGVYINASEDTDTADSGGIVIAEIAQDPVSASSLSVKVVGLNEDSNFKVFAALGSSSSSTDYLYTGTPEVTQEGEFSVISIPLKWNGTVLPLSAYSGNYITVTVEDGAGGRDYNSYFIERSSGVYQNVSLTLSEGTGDNLYDFTLECINCFLNIYEDTSPVFELKDSNSENTLASCSAVEKSTYYSNGETYYVFSGTFSTQSPLSDGTYYSIIYNNEKLWSANVTCPKSDKLSITSLSIAQMSYGEKTVHFNFDQLIVNASLLGDGETATAHLIDAETKKVLSSSEPTERILADTSHKYVFSVPKPDNLDGKTLALKFESDGNEVFSSSYSSSYAGLTFDDTVKEYEYFNIEPTHVGDKVLVLRYSDYSLKNITHNYFENYPYNIIHDSSETGVSYTVGDAYFLDGNWYVPLELGTPLLFGSYSIGGSRSFTVLPSSKIAIGSAISNTSSQTIEIRDCANLNPEDVYTCMAYSDVLGRVEEASLEYVSDSELCLSNIPEEWPNGSYSAEIYANGVYLGAINFSISWKDADDGSATIAAYHEQNGSYSTFDYFTNSNIVYLSTFMPGYSYVRYSEDINFDGTPYAPIKRFIDQPLKLSDGSGQKTIYIQFKNTAGDESTIYTLTCEVSESPEILDAYISCNGATCTSIPEDTEFTLSLVSNSMLITAYAQFVEVDNSTYYTHYSLSYIRETENGYLFECTLNSGDRPFNSSSYRFTGVEITLQSLSNQEIDTQELDISFNMLTPAFEDSSIYTNKDSYTVNGYGQPNSSVTLLWQENSRVINIGASGLFSFTLTNLSEYDGQTIRLSVENASGDSDTVYLYVDLTPPVIADLKATATSSNNVVITWSCSDNNIDSFFIFRNGLIIAECSSTEKSYIAANGINDVFKVVAIDKAGNESTGQEITVGDEEPPTPPTDLHVTTQSTKSITLGWSAATDNIAVYQYEVYRDNELVETLSYSELSYKDNGLLESTSYEYSVHAVDRAGNKSSAAKLTTCTAKLIISNCTEFDDTIVKEEHPNGYSVSLTLSKSSDAHSFDGTEANLYYKNASESTWSKQALTGSGNRLSGKWNIEPLEVGEYNLKFVVEDCDGTIKETAEVTTNITQDSTPPEVSIGNPVSGSTIGGGIAQKVSFSATDNVGVKKVELYYSTDGGESYILFAEVENSDPSALRFEKTVEFKEAADLVSGEITLLAKAYDLRENVGESEARKFKLDNTPPEAPTDLTVTSDDEKITLMWSYPTLVQGNDFSRFVVYRATSRDGEFAEVGGAAEIGFFDTVENGAAAGILYYYYVTAIDTRGNESEPTQILFGQLISDSESPSIVSVTPSEGSVLQNSQKLKLSAIDNYLLQKCVIEYKTASGEWVDLTTLNNADATREYVYEYEWNLESLEPGNYSVRFSVYDVSGNAPAISTVDYTITEYKAPQAPILTASADGHKGVLLEWTYDGNVDNLKSFRLYRSDDSSDYEYVCGLTPQDRSYKDIVSFEGSSKTYHYVLEAVDKYDAQARSAAVSVTAVSADDESPTAVISPASLAYAAVGESITLSAEASSDNDRIVSYSWDFGDGSTGSGVNVEHVFDAAGNYNVTLKVTDAYGNTGNCSVTFTVVDLSSQTSEYTMLVMNVTDAMTLVPVGGAEICVVGDDDAGMYTTNKDGVSSLVVPNGEYIVGFYADGYIVRTITISATGGVSEHSIGLYGSNIMSGSLTSTVMTYDEIVAAGIDPSAPGNEHVYKFAAEMSFTVGLKTYELPYAVYKNGQGKVVGTNGGFFSLGDGSENETGYGGLTIGLFPITEQFVLVIYGEARWLKEMFNVELVITNQSATDTLDQVIATLELPEGLSLADMIEGAQSEAQSLGNVGCNQTATARWYVRGDAEGEYNITAKVSAVSMPYGERIEQVFTTTEPIKVYAGSALKMTVTVNDVAERGEQYPVIFHLENVSDRPIYNLSFGITGVEQFKVLRIGNKEGNMPIDSEDFEDTFIRSVPELKPGDYIEMEISTTIWFNSVAEIGEAALKTYLNSNGLGFLGNFVEIQYYLQDVSLITLEGSTTAIPYDIVVNKTERPNLLIEVYEAAKELYGGSSQESGTLGDYLVEVFGYDLPTPLKEGGKMVISLAGGTTKYDVKISMPDMHEVDGKYQNEFISIECGDEMDVIFDGLNTITVTTDDRGSISLQGIKAGDAEMSISLGDSFGSSYKIPIIIDGEKVETSVDLSFDSANGTFSMGSDAISKIAKQLRESESSSYNSNPAMIFASHLDINLQGNSDELSQVVDIDAEALINDILENTVLTDMNISGDVANISVDRAALESMSATAGSSDTLSLSARRLDANTVKDMFGVDSPTYEFLCVVGDDIISSFNGGTVDVEVPYELSPGESAADIEVHRVADGGSYELVPSEYDSAAGLVRFTTDQFSYYQIVSDSHLEEAPEETPGEGPSEVPTDPDLPESGNAPVTTVNPDGSITTVIVSNRATTTTTEYPDGSMIIEERQNNGLIIITEVSQNGDTVITRYEPSGEKQIVIKKSGLQANVNVTASGKITATVNISGLDGNTVVELPVDLGAAPGTVSVRIQYVSGGVEVVQFKYSDGTISLELGGSAFIEILDFTPDRNNNVVFADVLGGSYFYDAVYWAAENGITDGVSSTLFDPYGSCTRAQVVTFIWRAMGSPAPRLTVNPFIDVSKDSYYYDAVLWAFENEITNGTSVTEFDPEGIISRAQAVTFLYRASGSPEFSSTGSFDDVIAEAFYYNAVLWAAQNGITSGTGYRVFSPNDTCIRAQIVTFLYRCFEASKTD